MPLKTAVKMVAIIGWKPLLPLFTKRAIKWVISQCDAKLGPNIDRGLKALTLMLMRAIPD